MSHEKFIRSNMSITRHMIAQGKSYIVGELKSGDSNIEKIIDSYLLKIGISADNNINFSQEHPETAYKEAADNLSWRFALGEATLELMCSGVVASASSSGQLHSVGKTLHFKHKSGAFSVNTQSLKLDLLVPYYVRLSPSHYLNTQQVFCDPDLFMQHANIYNIQQEIRESLGEAIRCFRYELYTACLAMLGKASEGAWIECGISLIKYAPHGSLNRDKEIDGLTSAHIGIGAKIEKILKLYKKQEIFEDIVKASGMRVRDLESAVIWADQVRDSRNTVHYGAKAHLPNTYETVAALLMGVVPHFKVLYAIKNAADEKRAE